ncbi:MAG: hypothetical protein ACJAVI_005247 [Candidatus Azotimanducaceae bacterium]|jgi:hypothetical protein
MSEERILSDVEYSQNLQEYALAGEARALKLGNRGKARFDSKGKLASDILDAYRLHGFYVFEGLVNAEEIHELQLQMQDLFERAPIDKVNYLDSHGRPAFGKAFKRNPYSFIRPLSDPWGGTDLLGGRHQTKMTEPTPDSEAPAKTIFLMHGMCQIMEAGLRLYGHNDLLAIAASINGPDFVPYNDAIFVKQPGLGGAVSWHQDGVTHWDAKNWDEGIHGFNFQVQLYTCTPQNCLWVVPGTHKLGKLDIKKLVAENTGSDQLSDAIPLMCRPGDVTIVNRQLLHGSFANTSPDLRVSLTFGFHRRASVLGQQGALSQTGNEIYDEERILERSAVIPIAIDARSNFYKNESRFEYQPFKNTMEMYRDTKENRTKFLMDYNLKDLSI